MVACKEACLIVLFHKSIHLLTILGGEVGTCLVGMLLHGPLEKASLSFRIHGKPLSCPSFSRPGSLHQLREGLMIVLRFCQIFHGAMCFIVDHILMGKGKR